MPGQWKPVVVHHQIIEQGRIQPYPLSQLSLKVQVPSSLLRHHPCQYV